MTQSGEKAVEGGSGITLMVGFSEQSASNRLAMLIAPALAEASGEPCRVTRLEGGNGEAAADAVSRSPADGRTLFVATLGTHALLPHSGRTTYDPIESFAPISLLASQPLVLAVHESLGVTDVAGLTRLARSRATPLRFGCSALGGAPHLAAELYARITGVKLAPAIYKETAELYADLRAGAIDMSFNNISSMRELTDARVKLLAVTADKRSPSLPDVPTMMESGVPRYSFSNWFVLVAPAGTEPRIVSKLNDQVRRTIAAIAPRLQQEGITPVASSPAEARSHLATELAKWESIAQRLAG
jgi:tripartite-type tricarboxylate transporter receptor subunit TctC